MRLLSLAGTLPATIVENTAPWNWFAQLRLAIDPASIAFLDLTGPGADFFDVRLNRSLGLLEVTPFARADFEAFSRIGASPTLSFDIRFFMADGTIAQSAISYSVTVLDRDDTPPQSLSFATGGRVNINTPGAVIGTLAVTDPDTASGFTYRLRTDDAWLFDIVGNQLRLKPGMVLTEYDGPIRSIFVEASDGTQSAGFELRINVANPALPGAPLANLVSPGERVENFSWSGTTLRLDLSLNDVARIQDYGANLRFTLRDGTDIWAAQPRRIDLLDADITYDVNSPEARVWNIYSLLMDAEVPSATQRGVAGLYTLGWTELSWTRAMLSWQPFVDKYGTMSNAQFVRMLYDNMLDWSVDQNTINWHAGRLAAGFPRENLVLELANWRKDVGLLNARAERGFAVEDPAARPVDIILRMGAGLEPDESWRALTDLWLTGQLALENLSNFYANTPAFQAKWAAGGSANFVRSFLAEAGSPIPEWQVQHFAHYIDMGWMTMGEVMTFSTRWLSQAESNSYVNLKPTGDILFT